MTRPADVSVSLVRLRTRDGVWLDGVIAEPRRRRRRTALIWVHGLGSAFSSGQPLIRELSRRLNAAGIRSEERRVGKEWRSRWVACGEKIEGLGLAESGVNEVLD